MSAEHHGSDSDEQHKGGHHGNHQLDWIAQHMGGLVMPFGEGFEK
jgi:hypothetical protein